MLTVKKESELKHVHCTLLLRFLANLLAGVSTGISSEVITEDS